MVDPQQRQRQRGIAGAEARGGAAAPRSQSYAPNSIWTPGIVRDVAGDLITWQRVRYKRGQVPTVGEYEAYGPATEVGYPQIPRAGTDYTALKVTGVPTTSSAIIRATWGGKFWIIETMGGGGTVFPIALTKTGGSQGTATAAASWTYTVKDFFTAEVLTENCNPTVSPGRFVRPNVGQMTQANFGYAHKNETGALVVGWVNEQVVQEACTS